MRIQTLSILAGSEACNAKCPFCISRMTPPHGVALKEPEVNWRNLRKACRIATRCGAITAMITGKGEPTLFPAQISRYLSILQEYDFPLVEMQTNGLLLQEHPEKYDSHLVDWYEKGLNTIAISIVHYDPQRNHEVFTPHRDHYIHLGALVDALHGKGFSVRLTCILADGFIDNAKDLDALIRFARETGAEQLTVTPVNVPADSRNPEVRNWTESRLLQSHQIEEMSRYLHEHGTQIRKLMHGAVVYDIQGQNVCFSSCLSLDAESEDLRHLIYFPDGHLRYDWQYPGAILL